ncbi:MAG: porphobilinogen synthase [Thermoprotei archaeon]
MRPRRTRANPIIRELVAETSLTASRLIYPVFVSEAAESPEPVPSMPGIQRHTLDSLLKHLEQVRESGIKSILIFGVPSSKDPQGSSAYDRNGVVQNSLRRIRESFGREFQLIADTCLCEYTSHGHCGILKGDQVDNDQSLVALTKTALSQAEAGADIVAPSAMMDGQVGAIRNGLDDSGFKETMIMAYSAKYASVFYGPFRSAADSKPSFGDRRSYQMDPRNSREALKEVELDIEEGADIVMVKPALPYLDLIRVVHDRFNHPLAAYQVSGEYSMIKGAAMNGFLDEKSAVLETLYSISRAGANMIITYYAPNVAEWIQT